MESREIMERAQHTVRMELEKYPETVQTTLQLVLLNNAYELSQIQSTDTMQGIANAKAARKMGMHLSKRQKKNKTATASASQPPIAAAPLLSSSAVLVITVPLTLPLFSSLTALALANDASISNIPEASDEAKKPYITFELGTGNVNVLARAELSPEKEEAIVTIESKLGKEKESTHSWKWMIPAPKRYDREKWIPEYMFKLNGYYKPADESEGQQRSVINNVVCIPGFDVSSSKQY
ncbi:hypothetical protein V5O48_008142 [Marasmius crinis-equi]|uniref:Uncharacterized protein n=1 Tax=Marasmius crinis-equi TaxID=585013 RepID=A0ABR3FEU7_9AGAR